MKKSENPSNPNDLGSAGGKARAKKLQPEQRQAIARAAAIARWTKVEKIRVKSS